MSGRLILASKSPRRLELMRVISEDFEVVPAVGEEIIPDGIACSKAAEFLAEQKAREVYEKNTGAIVIGADTVVVCDGEIMGKPVDENDAAQMLRKLSGKTHSVFTGVCICGEYGERSFTEETAVEFSPLDGNEIGAYIATGEPMDKAGAYGIQERGSLFVKRINGDFFNVMGLPVAKLARELGLYEKTKNIEKSP